MDSILTDTSALQPVESIPNNDDNEDDVDLEDMVEVSVPEDSDANAIEKEDPEAAKKKNPVWKKPDKKKKAGKKSGGGKQKQKTKAKQKTGSESGPGGDQVKMQTLLFFINSSLLIITLVMVSFLMLNFISFPIFASCSGEG